MISSSISSEDVQFIESRHLLRLLGEINDIEIIWLRYYLNPYMGGDEDFRDKHSEIIEPIQLTIGSPPEVVYKSTLQDSYKEHLTSLGFLAHKIKRDFDTDLPEFDNLSGGFQVQGYQITLLGKLLLDHIGLSDLN